MKLKIDFDIAKKELAHQWPSFYMMGSCFAQNQAMRMKQLGFKITSNPFGIIYNPVSINTLLERIVSKRYYTNADFERRDTVFSWEHHGDFKFNSTADAVIISNKILDDTLLFLSKSNVIVLTLGTSLVHTYNGKTVANCHKIPNTEFTQRQLGYTETLESLTSIVALTKQLNPTAQIIFTLSPIRHLRSGIIENSRSKATLLAAVHDVIIQNENTCYFPSYEIFIDELRDYRFAKEDMTHPTKQAEEFIWERFCDTYFSKETNQCIKDVSRLNLFASHKPKDLSLHAIQIADKKEHLLNKYPFLYLT